MIDAVAILDNFHNSDHNVLELEITRVCATVCLSVTFPVAAVLTHF